MKYKLVGSNFIFNPIETVLENRGITKELFSANKSCEIPFENLDNIDRGIEILMNNIDKKIVLVIDSDCDGMTSSAILYRYLKEEFKNINIEFKIHTKKQHGLSEDIIIEDDISLVILPDASSNDFKQHYQLYERGIGVLVLDHHECDLGYSNNAIVINNQLSKNYSNKSLSGVGIVYRFLQSLDGYLFTNNAYKYLDLVSLGNVADMMNLKSEETRYYVYEGIKNITNPFIKALIEDNGYDLGGKFNIEKIGWTIAPKINGVIRSGSMEDKINMFKAFISDDYNFCLQIAKSCKKIKTKQDRDVKSSMAKLERQFKFKKINKCLILDTNKDLSSTHRGLVAGKLADKYGVPTLLYKDVKNKDGYVKGSFRGCNFTENFRGDLLDSKIMVMAQGHDNAGGWELKKEDIPKLEEYINELYKNKEISLSKEYEVDFELDSSELDNWMIDELAEYEDEWGNGIKPPLLAIKNVNISSLDLNINRCNIIFGYGYIKFIKNFATNILKNELSSREDIVMNIIGKCTIDTYKNQGQIEIVDLEILN